MEEQSTQQKRVWALDMVRGLCLVTMVMVHIVNTLSHESVKENGFGLATFIIASLFSARGFIFILGAGLIFSKRINLKYCLKRGLMLVGLGYVLNVFRGVIPIYLNLKLEVLEVSDLDANSTIWATFFENDILQFAGLSFIILGVVKHYIRKPVIWIILGFVAIFLSPYIWNMNTPYDSLNMVLTLCFGKGPYNRFPVFPWIGYALMGMAYGHYLLKAEDKEKMIITGAGIGLVLFFVGWPIVLADPSFNLYKIYHYATRTCPIGINILLTGALLISIMVFHFVISNIPQNAVFEKIYYWSKHVTAFYFLQWVIIGWICVEVGELGDISTAFFMFIVILATDQGIALYHRSAKAISKGFKLWFNV